MKTMINKIFHKSKICLIAVAFVLLCGMRANAQDTISDEEITYIFPQPWPGNSYLWYHTNSGWYRAWYFYTDTQLPIIGVATSARCYLEGGDCAVTLGLWKHLPSGMFLLAEGVIDPAFPSRYMEVIGIIRHQNGDTPQRYIFPIQETRFDSAIMVQDSFYVSYYSSYNWSQYLAWGLRWYQEDGLHLAGGELGSNGLIWTFATIHADGSSHVERLPFLFPIIDTTGWNYIPPCDTMTCANTSEFHLMTQAGNYATFAWVGAPEHTEWEVSYGPVGTAPEDGRVLHPTTTNAIISNLDTGRHYVAFVRGFCPECKVWSEWSEGVEFWVGMNEPTQKIPTVEQLTHLAPNPARDKVQVFSSFGIRKVGIYNAQGEQVATQQVSGYSTMLDISTLPAGLYFVNVHTPAGTVTKKLVVE